MHDVVVIGGGAIGLAIARELATDRSVILVERDRVGEGTSWAAAGMLSPQSEADQAGPFFELSMASLHLYRHFTSDLKDETGIDPEYGDEGLLLLASSAEESEILRKRWEWQRAAGMTAEWISGDDARRLEPLISLPLSGALFVPGDHQVASRKLVRALHESCVRRGVDIRTGVSAREVVVRNGSAAGVVSGSEWIPAGAVIAAAGVWSGTISGMVPPIPVHPRKGQILSVMPPARVFTRMIRWGHIYLVPRRDGELVIGATNEDAGFDRQLTPAGLGGLLTGAQRISASIGAFPIHETWTGLRPATPDELPVIGPSDIRNLWYAAGHYRNGILLAPITAVIMRALICGTAPPVGLDSFSPNRFQIV